MKIEKWYCYSKEKFGVECSTYFYVEGEYKYQPYCPNCGSENHIEFIGVVEIKEDKVNEVSSR
jgi:hypothetical protein